MRDSPFCIYSLGLTSWDGFRCHSARACCPVLLSPPVPGVQGVNSGALRLMWAQCPKAQPAWENPPQCSWGSRVQLLIHPQLPQAFPSPPCRDETKACVCQCSESHRGLGTGVQTNGLGNFSEIGARSWQCLHQSKLDQVPVILWALGPDVSLQRLLPGTQRGQGVQQGKAEHPLDFLPWDHFGP